MDHDEDEPTQPIFLEDAVLKDDPSQPLPSPDPDRPVDRADVLGEGARSLAAWCGRFLIVAVTVVVIGWGLSHVTGALVPITMGLLVASVLYPVTAGLRRIGVPYGLGAVLSLLAGVAVIGGLIALIAPSVANQWPSLVDQTLRGVRQVQSWAAGPPLNLRDEQLNEYVQQAINWVQEHSGDVADIVVNVGGNVGSGIVTMVMTFVLVFFMLKDGHKFVGWTRTIVGRRGGFHVSELFTRLWNTISGYIRTQAIVSFVDALFIGLGLWLLDVPLAFPIAILTFMAGFIPIVGAVTAGAVAVLVALVTAGWVQALIVLGLVILVQQIEGNVLQPVLQSRVMQLHPVVIILAVLLGGGWAGILGAFLAVPVAASMAVVFRYLGDMTDLRTGEKVAADINWATEDGSVIGGRSEQSALFFQDLVRRRLRGEPRVYSRGEPVDETQAQDQEKRERRPWSNLFRRRQQGAEPDDPKPKDGGDAE